MFLIRRQKQSILRAVYKENLRIVGKSPLVPRWPLSAIFLRWHALSLFVLLIALLGNAGHLDSTFRGGVLKGSLPEGALPVEYLSMIGGAGVPLKQMFGLGVKTIVIDPGHGGTDPGAEGKLGLKEKDITLDIAHRLRERLRSRKLNTVLTREDDGTLPLHARTEFANSMRADLFVSIHVNYLPSRPINIIETYYFGPSEDKEALSLAVKENADSHYRLGEFKEMIEKIGDTLKLQESRKFASLIQQSLYLNIRQQNSGVLDYGIKRAPFVVLLGVEMPGVLAEVSCLSNKEEELKLYTARYREDIARYLESGILNYLGKGDPLYEARR